MNSKVARLYRTKTFRGLFRPAFDATPMTLKTAYGMDIQQGQPDLSVEREDMARRGPKLPVCSLPFCRADKCDRTLSSYRKRPVADGGQNSVNLSPRCSNR